MSFNFTAIKKALAEAGYEVSKAETMLSTDFQHLFTFAHFNFGLSPAQVAYGLAYPETITKEFPGHPDATKASTPAAAIETPAPVAAPVAETPAVASPEAPVAPAIETPAPTPEPVAQTPAEPVSEPVAPVAETPVEETPAEPATQETATETPAAESAPAAAEGATETPAN